MSTVSNKIIFACIIFSLALVASSFFIGKSLERFKLQDRSVLVKGIGEKNVTADFATWNISFKSFGKSLQEAKKVYVINRNVVAKFIEKEGFTSSEYQEQPPKVTAKKRHLRLPKKELFENTYDYEIETTFMVQSDNIKKVEQASAKTQELLEFNIILQKNHYGANPKYHLRDFDSLRPQLLEEATKSAHSMALKFAKHSKTKIGGVKTANQGNFSIQSVNGDYNEDAYPIKKVRVVSYITYFLD